MLKFLKPTAKNQFQRRKPTYYYYCSSGHLWSDRVRRTRLVRMLWFRWVLRMAFPAVARRSFTGGRVDDCGCKMEKRELDRTRWRWRWHFRQRLRLVEPTAAGSWRASGLRASADRRRAGKARLEAHQPGPES